MREPGSGWCDCGTSTSDAHASTLVVDNGDAFWGSIVTSIGITSAVVLGILLVGLICSRIGNRLRERGENDRADPVFYQSQDAPYEIDAAKNAQCRGRTEPGPHDSHVVEIP
jgi:hypothetical protein